jgi:hypothetical protein
VRHSSNQVLIHQACHRTIRLSPSWPLLDLQRVQRSCPAIDDGCLQQQEGRASSKESALEAKEASKDISGKRNGIGIQMFGNSGVVTAAE